MKLLVTACKAPSGASILHLLRDHPEVETVGVDARDGFPWGSSPDWPHAMREAAADCAHVLVCSDPELTFVRRLDVETFGKVVTADQGLHDIALDKVRLYRTLRNAGIPAPRYLVDGMIKPRSGGTTGPNRVGRLHPNEMACEYLPGQEWSVDLLHLRGDEVARVARRRLEVEGGVCVSGGVAGPSHSIHTAVTRALEHLGALGVFHGGLSVQFIEDADHVLHLTDLNVRFGGGITIAAAAGVNLPWLLADHLLGKDPVASIPRMGVCAAERVWT